MNAPLCWKSQWNLVYGWWSNTWQFSTWTDPFSLSHHGYSALERRRSGRKSNLSSTLRIWLSANLKGSCKTTFKPQVKWQYYLYILLWLLISCKRLTFLFHLRTHKFTTDRMFATLLYKERCLSVAEWRKHSCYRIISGHTEVCKLQFSFLIN